MKPITSFNNLMVDMVPRFSMEHRENAPDIGDLLIIKKEDGSGVELAVTLSQRRDTEILFTIVKVMNAPAGMSFNVGGSIRLSAGDIYHKRWTVCPAEVIRLDGIIVSDDE